VLLPALFLSLGAGDHGNALADPFRPSQADPDTCFKFEQLWCPQPAENAVSADEVHRFQCAGSRSKR